MKVLIIVILIAFSLQGYAQKEQILETPKVDKRVELLSIVFRLAGNPEYNSSPFKLYTGRIDKHFSPYKNHALILFAKKMKSESGVSYDSPMAMAIHLDQNLNPLTKFTDDIPEKRWGEKNANEFVKLLKQFYEDTQFEAFFKINEDLYKEISTRFLPVYEKLDLNWYPSFYGKEPSEKFVIAIAPVNGGCNYGTSYISSKGEKEVYAIMGACCVDSLGMTEFSINSDFPILIHEFNHSFVNYLLDKNKKPFRESGEKIFEVVEQEMKSQAYVSWELMLNEALVRAAVIKYIKDHHFPQQEIDYQVDYEINRSFFWIKDVVAELEYYDTHRETYPNLESYMPKLAEAYVGFAEEVVLMNEKRPKVESIAEFKNGDTNVDANLKMITINFDKPLSPEKGYSVYYGKKGEQTFPGIKKVYYSNENKSFIMEVELESDKEYQFKLVGENFMTPEGLTLKPYEVNFKTGK